MTCAVCKSTSCRADELHAALPEDHTLITSEMAEACVAERDECRLRRDANEIPYARDYLEMRDRASKAEAQLAEVRTAIAKGETHVSWWQAERWRDDRPWAYAVTLGGSSDADLAIFVTKADAIDEADRLIDRDYTSHVIPLHPRDLPPLDGHEIDTLARELAAAMAEVMHVEDESGFITLTLATPASPGVMRAIAERLAPRLAKVRGA